MDSRFNKETYNDRAGDMVRRAAEGRLNDGEQAVYDLGKEQGKILMAYQLGQKINDMLHIMRDECGGMTSND